jgi:hypothetical protein
MHWSRLRERIQSLLARKSRVARKLDTISPDAANVEKICNLLQRIPLNQKQISFQAWSHSSTIRKPEPIGCQAGGTPQYFNGQQSGLVDQEPEFNVERSAKDRGFSTEHCIRPTVSQRLAVTPSVDGSRY